MSSGATDPMDAYVDAMAVYEAWLVRKSRGEAESADEFLAAHEGLRPILRGMVANDETVTLVTPPTGVRSPSGPAADEDFGAYRILSVIGQGGMGTVYLAEHRELQRRVALKVIRPERLFSPVAKERFWREARAVAQLEHPNICPVYEVGEVDGIPFMAMRFLAGKSLAELIAAANRIEGEHSPSLAVPGPATSSGDAGTARPGSESVPASRTEIHKVIALVESVARGLHAAHESGIIHRDIKPGNILVTDEGEAVVLDFGLARAEEADDEPALTMSGDLAGTPLYMSPEQIDARGRTLDRTTDIFSLGVTLYECLTLRRPFEGASIRELQDTILESDPMRPTRINRHVPRDLEIVMHKAIDKDPARRYRSAHEFAEDLRRVRSFEPILARPVGIGVRITRWSQRYPLAASFLVFVTIALGMVSWQFWAASVQGAEYDQIASTHRLDVARTAEAKLYPARPSRLHLFEGWSRKHGSVMTQRLPGLEEALQVVRARAIPGSDPLEFAAESDAFKYGMLSKLVPRTRDFVAGDWGEVERVRQLTEWMRTVEKQTIGDRASEWKEAIEAITAHPDYGGRTLQPQVGLVPLEPDPKSGFWEFVHVRSGEEIPARDPETGRYKIEANSRIVFVLIPGGTFWMGAESEKSKKRTGHNLDAAAGKPEGPPHEVSLDWFFISKYELTRGQWLALKGAKLRWLSGTFDGKRVTHAHPVERMDYFQATTTLGWYGLQLPTEAQWEYAYRAGSDTPYPRGDDYGVLAGQVNIADASARRIGQEWTEIGSWKGLDDHYPAHGPVDYWLPNPWGLHGMAGNVWEFCRDRYGRYSRAEIAPGSGLHTYAKPGSSIVIRGGCYDEGIRQLRSAYRVSHSRGAAANNYGCRAVRAVEGPR